MLADEFTKPLPRPLFVLKRSQIGVRDVIEVMRTSTWYASYLL